MHYVVPLQCQVVKLLKGRNVSLQPRSQYLEQCLAHSIPSVFVECMNVFLRHGEK